MSWRISPTCAEPDELVTAVQRVRDSLAEEMVEFWLQVRVTTSQFHALHAIRRHGRVSGRQLACALGVSPAAVVALCDRLEQQGYVARVRDPADRRVCWVELTGAGEAVFDGLVSIGRSHLAPALARLSAGDRESLTRGLNALADALAAAPQPTSSAAPQFGRALQGLVRDVDPARCANDQRRRGGWRRTFPDVVRARGGRRAGRCACGPGSGAASIAPAATRATHVAGMPPFSAQDDL